MFLKSVDASNKMKDGKLLFKLLDDMVEEVGEESIVQVISDNASAYKYAGSLLMEKRKQLYSTPCVAYCLDLMLEKLGELPQHKHALSKAKKVINFIYNHGWVLHCEEIHTRRVDSPNSSKIYYCIFDFIMPSSIKTRIRANVHFWTVVNKCLGK